MLLTLILLLLPALALAEDCGCAEDCCTSIKAAAAQVKHRVCGMDLVCHRDPQFCDPGGCHCLPEACHKPLMTCDPCVEICLEEVCHKPVVGLLLEDCCDCPPVLTGERPSGCDCGCHGEG